VDESIDSALLQPVLIHRQVCSVLRTGDFDVLDRSGNRIAVVREVGVTGARAWLRPLGRLEPLTHPSLVVRDPSGTIILSLTKPRNLVRGRFLVRDAAGTDIVTFDSDTVPRISPSTFSLPTAPPGAWVALHAGPVAGHALIGGLRGTTAGYARRVTAADAFVSPSYDDACLTEVASSAMAALGVEGFENRLSVPDIERIALLLVDGLGWRQLRRHADVAPFLSAVAEGAAGTGRPISTPFPSTTATSLASIGTGLPPGAHGLVGYAFRVPGHDDRVMNALRWQLYGQGPQVGLGAELPPATFQPFASMFERARSGGVDVCLAGPEHLGDAPLTRAVLRGGRYESAHSLGDLSAVVSRELDAPGRRLVYGYHANLDTTGHVRGANSEAWRLELGHVDRLASDIAQRLRPGAALVVTADHGMVDVPEERRLDLADRPELATGVQMLGGEGRARHIYVEPGAESDVAAAWQVALGDGAWVGSRDQAIGMGWFGPDVRHEVRSRIGDVVMAASEPVGVFQRLVDPVQSRLLGHHGSLTPDEALVPFLLILS
jgi:hypothetical protein